MRRTVGLVVGYLLIFSGLVIAAPAGFFVLLKLSTGDTSSQLVPLAGGLALSGLGIAQVYLTDRFRPGDP